MAYNSRKIDFPDLIVFDLDYTLWPFWVDSGVFLPFRRDSFGKILDARNHELKCFADVPQILSELYRQGIKMAVASRTTCKAEATKLLELLEWDKYFTYRKIYPGNKMHHFKAFEQESGILLSRMLFFDDEDRNVTDVSALGVTSVLVEDGMTRHLLQEGLRAFAATQAGAAVATIPGSGTTAVNTRGISGV